MRFILSMAWRLRKDRASASLLSFISLSSILGVGLGCFVLIILLSVMNGFERELKSKVLSQVAHGELIAVNEGGIVDWSTQLNQLSSLSSVLSVQPRNDAIGMLQKGMHIKAIELHGLDVNYLDGYDRAMVTEQTWQAFRQIDNAMLLSQQMLDDAELSIGDLVKVMLAPQRDDGKLTAPKSIAFKIVGVTAKNATFNPMRGIVKREYLGRALGYSNLAQRLQFRFNEPFIAASLIRDIGYRFNQYVYLSDWTRTQGHLYNDIKLVRFVVYIALVLLIAVACFNIVSTLLMAVNEKQSSIAVLKTMGMGGLSLRLVFVLLGMINGLVGALFGCVLGTAFAFNLTDLATGIERLFDTRIIDGDVYFIDFLPSLVVIDDVIITFIIAILLSFLATLYPANKAANLSPARVLAH